jgi:hypothetical protein
MSEKSRLMRSLFEMPGKELLNLKFFRFDSAEKLTEDAFCARVNKIIFEIDAGLTASTNTFGDEPAASVNVKELAAKFA